MTTDACACPRLRARDCLRVRSGRDLSEIAADETGSAEEVCECSCHDEQDEECDEW